MMLPRVSDALSAESVLVQPAWGDLDETIRQLVARLVTAGRIPAALAAEAVRSIQEREAVASTAMVDIGVSIPHARLDGVAGIVAAMAVSPQAVYNAGNRLPISIVVLVLSSPALTGEHLSFLSSLSMLLQSARVRQRLRNAETPQEVEHVIRANE
jgi:mannitol/fructose-specific phosphotransferase system IIA component (Ntr-type)